MIEHINVVLYVPEQCSSRLIIDARQTTVQIIKFFFCDSRALGGIGNTIYTESNAQSDQIYLRFSSAKLTNRIQ